MSCRVKVIVEANDQDDCESLAATKKRLYVDRFVPTFTTVGVAGGREREISVNLS